MSESQAGWVQGSGARKRSLDGKTNSPHYGGYTTHAVESGDLPHGVIVVECYCFLINIIDVGVARVSDVSSGLFCIHIKNEGFVSTKRRGAFRPLLAADPDESQQQTFFLVLASQDGSGGSVISSFGAWKWILASLGRGFCSSDFIKIQAKCIMSSILQFWLM